MTKNAFLTPFFAVLVLLTGVHLAPVYTTLTATYDEPYHIAAGMEWLDKGVYTYEVQHPPLARIAVALGPWLKGLRSRGQKEATDEGNAILYEDGKYWENLRLARLGNLPYLALAAAVVFLWARRWFNPLTAVWAVLLFLSLPPILGHAALATLDIGCAATVGLALYAFQVWSENPRPHESVLLGAALALAFLTKFSSIPFLAIGIVAILASRKQWPRWRMLPLAAVVCLVILWAGYRFSLVPVSSHFRTPLPLGQIALGMAEVNKHNRDGHPSYLLGESRDTGWWFFFPVVLGVKTPLVFLVLASAGLWLGWKQHRATVLIPLGILAFCLTSRIDLGVRHILSVYLPLAALAGYTLARLPLPVAALLGLAAVGESFLSHPDYQASFNALAGQHPERILCESDLDWGQDLHRLSIRLKELGVKQVAIRYFGTAPLDKAGLPEFHVLSPTERAEGWVAVSVRYTTLEAARTGNYSWLKTYTPVERIGKSIDLYQIP